ncbi:MAG: hypothetical protein P8046_00870 [Anaerolineales bacterium]
MEYGYVGTLELLFFFLIVFLVVGPRRIIRGIRAIKAWVRNGFRRVQKSKTAKKSRKILRGFGSMAAYYQKHSKSKED